MNDLSKSLMCVQLRSGIEIWVEEERARTLQEILSAITQSKFIRFEGETFNEDEYSIPLSLDSLGMSWADFM